MKSPSATTEVDPAARTSLHPDLQPFAEHVLNSLRLTVEKAVAHGSAPEEFPLPSESSLEATLAQRFAERPAASRSSAAERIMPLARSDAATRTKTYGPLGQVNLRAAVPVLRQAEPHAPPLRIVDKALLAIDEKPQTDILIKPLKKDKPPFSGFKIKAFTDLELRLRAVKCVDETDGFLGSESGDDEIGLGIIKLDPDGQVSNLGIHVVGTEFDDGETKHFDPPKVLARWSYADDKVVMKGSKPFLYNGKPVPVGWPRTYGAMFLLSELDNGGFPKSLQAVCDQIRYYVVDKVGTAVATAVGEFFGGPLGAAVGAAIGKVVAEIAEWIMNGMIDFFIAIWNDDAFPTVVSRTTRSSSVTPFSVDGKGVRTAKGMWWLKAHGGHYEIYFDWHLVGGSLP